MTNRDDYFDLIRQLVRGDHKGYAERCEQLDEKGWEGFGLVAGAAFYKATTRRFDGSYNATDVIRFVADFRADVADTGFDVDPLVAERLIQAALTDDAKLIEDLSPGVIVEAEMLMLWKLLGPLSESELTLFFAEADALADRWSR